MMSIIYCAANAVCGTLSQWTSSLGHAPHLPGSEAYTRSNRNDEDPLNLFAMAVPVLITGSIVSGAVAGMTVPPRWAASYAVGAASMLAAGAGWGCPPLLLAGGVFSLGLSACSYWVQRCMRNALARETAMAIAALPAVQPDVVDGLQQRELHQEFPASRSEIDALLQYLHPVAMAERGETPLEIAHVQKLVGNKFGVTTGIPWGAAAYGQASLIRTRRDVALRTTWQQLRSYEGDIATALADAKCPITQESLSTLEDPVLCKVGETYQLCSFRSFQDYWILSGKNVFSMADVSDWAENVFLKVG